MKNTKDEERQLLAEMWLVKRGMQMLLQSWDDPQDFISETVDVVAFLEESAQK